ncbi:MAG: hypothetical protein VW080_02280 [Flavobacteriaceae bacterium]
MNKFILILTILLFIKCTKTDCIVITRKEKTGNNFLFFFADEYNRLYNNTTVVDEYGALPSGAVTEEIYNQYEVGDTYCIE